MSIVKEICKISNGKINNNNVIKLIEKQITKKQEKIKDIRSLLKYIINPKNREFYNDYLLLFEI